MRSSTGEWTSVVAALVSLAQAELWIKVFVTLLAALIHESKERFGVHAYHQSFSDSLIEDAGAPESVLGTRIVLVVVFEATNVSGLFATRRKKSMVVSYFVRSDFKLG